MRRIILYILLSFIVTFSSGAMASQYATQVSVASPASTQPATPQTQSQNVTYDKPANETQPVLQAAPSQAPSTPGTKAILILFVQGTLLGLLAVFTPYLYKIHPFTTGYLTRNIKSARSRWLRVFAYAGSLILIFTLLGALATLIIKFARLEKFTEHWIFNLFFLRIFFTLGLLFLDAFPLKLPEKLINAISSKAQTNSLQGIFLMAFTLPVASFSSTFPVIGLVLVLAGNVPVIGPLIGMLGFGAGLAIPFVFPSVISIFAKSKSILNNVKVTMGFFCLMLALKFASKADASLGLHLLDRDMFIIVWVGIWGIMGLYLLGLLKLSHDTEREINNYGIEYTSLSRLFIAIFAFVFAIYLLPGIWGAPLRGISGFLPQ